MPAGDLEYVEFPAPPALEEVVRCVWVLSGPACATPEPQPIVPDGCAEIVLNLADQFRRVRGGGAWETQPRAMIVGQIRRTSRTSSVASRRAPRRSSSGATGR